VKQPQQALEAKLWKSFQTISLDKMIREQAEALRDEARRTLAEEHEKCPETQELIKSLRVEQGSGATAYQVVADGKYGAEKEFGTANSTESPWFIPAFVTVRGSIGTCLQQTLRAALLKAGRLHRVR
jgi:hypothetical protein